MEPTAEKLPPERPRWMVVSTHAHRETLALENLVRQGFTIYCPVILKRIRHARRTMDSPRPLFPGYLFAEQGPAHRWRAALGTYGVRSVICNGEMPALLPGGFVESLKAREIDGIIQKPERPFAPGQTVVVNGGPLDGLTGQVLEVRERDRIILLLDVLSGKAKVNLRAEGLLPA